MSRDNNFIGLYGALVGKTCATIGFVTAFNFSENEDGLQRKYYDVKLQKRHKNNGSWTNWEDTIIKERTETGDTWTENSKFLYFCGNSWMFDLTGLEKNKTYRVRIAITSWQGTTPESGISNVLEFTTLDDLPDVDNYFNYTKEVIGNTGDEEKIQAMDLMLNEVNEYFSSINFVNTSPVTVIFDVGDTNTSYRFSDHEVKISGNMISVDRVNSFIELIFNSYLYSDIFVQYITGNPVYSFCDLSGDNGQHANNSPIYRYYSHTSFLTEYTYSPPGNIPDVYLYYLFTMASMMSSYEDFSIVYADDYSNIVTSYKPTILFYYKSTATKSAWATIYAGDSHFDVSTVPTSIQHFNAEITGQSINCAIRAWRSGGGETSENFRIKIETQDGGILFDDVCTEFEIDHNFNVGDLQYSTWTIYDNPDN